MHDTTTTASDIGRVLWVRVGGADAVRVAELGGFTMTVWRVEPGSWRMSVRPSRLTDRADVCVDAGAGCVHSAMMTVASFVRDGAGKAWSPERVMRFGDWTRIARFVERAPVAPPEPVAPAAPVAPARYVPPAWMGEGRDEADGYHDGRRGYVRSERVRRGWPVERRTPEQRAAYIRGHVEGSKVYQDRTARDGLSAE